MPVTPTPASEWKSETKQDVSLGFMVTLPSGNNAKVTRSVDFFVMLRENRIPNPLADIVSKMINAKQDESGNAIMPDMSAEQVGLMFEFVNKIACDIMLEPRCVIPPTDPGALAMWVQPEGAIIITELSDEDRMYLFGVALGGTTDLAAFRKEQAKAVAVGSDGAAVPHKAITVPRTRPLSGVVSR